MQSLGMYAPPSVITLAHGKNITTDTLPYYALISMILLGYELLTNDDSPSEAQLLHRYGKVWENVVSLPLS